MVFVGPYKETKHNSGIHWDIDFIVVAGDRDIPEGRGIVFFIVYSSVSSFVIFC